MRPEDEQLVRNIREQNGYTDRQDVADIRIIVQQLNQNEINRKIKQGRRSADYAIPEKLRMQDIPDLFQNRPL